MLGSVDCRNLDLAVMPNRIDYRLQALCNGALIRYDSDPPAAEFAPGAAQEDLVAELDACRRRRLSRDASGTRERQRGAAG